MGYDSKHWDWGVGFCRKHRGNSTPCQACIDTNDPDLVIEMGQPKTDGINEILDVNFGGGPNVQNIKKDSEYSAIMSGPQYGLFEMDFAPVGNEFFTQEQIAKIGIVGDVRPKGQKLGFYGEVKHERPPDFPNIHINRDVPVVLNPKVEETIFKIPNISEEELFERALVAAKELEFFNPGLGYQHEEIAHKVTCLYKHTFPEPLIVQPGQTLEISYSMGRYGFENVTAAVKQDKPSFFDELVDAAGKQYQELIDHGGTPEQIAQIGFDEAFPEVKLFHPPRREENLAHPAFRNFGDKTVESRSLMGERALQKVEETATAHIIELYNAQPLAVDALPYTVTLQQMAISVIKLTRVELPRYEMEKFIFNTLIRLRKDRKLSTKG